MSQEQIDNLLKSLSGDGDSDSGGGGNAPKKKAAEIKPEKKCKLYDFQNPKIFSKEQIRTISIIYDNYAKHLSSFLSGYLRTDCAISINAVEEQKYFEYSNALPESIMMGVLNVKPIEGNMLIEIKKDTCYLIIDRLLGGSGEEPVVQIDFSDIELKLLDKFYKQIIRYLKDSWSNVADIDPELNELVTNARLTQLMPLDEVVIIVLLSVKIRDYEGSMSICIPCINLENLLGNSNTYRFLNRKKKNIDSEETKANIFENLKGSKIDIRGILGNTTLTLQDLLYLQVGDVIPLDKPVDSPAVVRVGTIDCFSGDIGVRKNKMAVKIKNAVRDLS